MSIVVMGVSGAGKSTVAAALAAALGGAYIDADDLHPAENVAKMAAGVPLDDGDRMPWLRLVGGALAEDRLVVVACSALRRTYRDVLRDAASRVFFVHLDVDPAVLSARLAQRTDHFMPASLLASQLATLEPLDADEAGIVVDAAAPLAEIIPAAAEAWRRAES
ncbi:gluconokinase [Microbacterium sp.]|uniref:gluconokinase n=1 Tax=Microbacterium sp. TaxID=51671 RepID=UPI003F6F9811